MPGDEDVLVEDKECEGARPGTQELCNSHKKCGKEKRFKSQLPDKMMRRIWYQSLKDPDLYHYVSIYYRTDVLLIKTTNVLESK